MQLKVTGRDLTLTRSLKDYIEKRLERVQRHIPRIISVDAVLSKERQDHVVDVRLKSASFTLAVSGRSPDMYASIDETISKLERAAIRRKERKIQTPRQRARRAQVDRAGHEEMQDDGMEGVKTTRLSVKPMSAEEALLQLKMLQYAFFVFEDSYDNHVKVIYRRNDGSFGLIDPDVG